MSSTHAPKVPLTATALRPSDPVLAEVSPLFQPLTLGAEGPDALTLNNRVIMAPLTRMRAGAGNVPQPINAEYYRQRASAGLIISEATPVSPFGHGYVNTPGIHTPEQAEGWQAVTHAVHEEGGLIFMQLWHVGRQSHNLLQPGGVLPVAPSALSAEGEAPTPQGMKAHPIPRALETDEIPGIVAEFRQGAELAKQAGFDGVEVHGANGYLLEQFLSDHANYRTDRYGGSVENRARLLLEVVDAVVGVWGASRVGVRLSPSSTFGNIHPSNRWAQFSHVVEALNPRQLAYIHLVEPRIKGDSDTEPVEDLGSDQFRPLITGHTRLIGAGGYQPEAAARAIAEGTVDAVAFGRLFISNPDLPRRIATGAALTPYNRATFYGGNEQGYTDYPALP